MLTSQQALPTTCVVPVSELSGTNQKQMYKLYQTYYCNSNESIFLADLQAKNHAVLLKDNQGVIQGFSTLALYEEEYRDSRLNIIYSGDTIVDKAFWGHPLLPKAWLQFAGKVAADSPDIPLYWLLIVKGHRTYRYLPLFSQNYYPRYNRKTPPDKQNLINHVATRRFKSAYDPASGLVVFPGPRSFLKPDLAEIPEKDIQRPEVQFFLSQNPHYAHGDEMVCLCELSTENLTRISRKWFMEGMWHSPIRRQAEFSTAGMSLRKVGTGFCNHAS